MKKTKDFDVIIVGAGPAGSSAATMLASAGKSVLLVERGAYPGSKSVTGGKVNLDVISGLGVAKAGDFPVERHLVQRWVGEGSLADGLIMSKEDSSSSQDFSVLRSRFDRWLGGVAEDAGAFVLKNMRVDSLLIEDGAVTGILSGDDAVTADCVIAADGLKSHMAKSAGLIPPHLDA